MRVATTMRDHGQHQTCITMHRTKWRPARRSSRAVRPDRDHQRPGSIPRRGKGVNTLLYGFRFISRHDLTTSFGRFYPPTDLVAAATAAAPYGLCMIWCRTALSRSNAEVRKAVKNARRDHYARPRTAPDMHHDASYEVASSAEVIQGRTARSRPSATRVHSPGWERG